MAINNCPFDITPYAKSEITVKPVVFNLNYTNQDFWSMKNRLIDFIQQKFGDKFNDFVESDISIMLIENWAFIADTLSFKMDQIANEIFIDTVTEKENAFRLAKLVGFEPQPPISARSLFSASIQNPLTSDLTIPTPLDISFASGGESITYELFPADANNKPMLDQDIVIPAGSVINASVIGLEGKTYNDNPRGNGQINQMYQLEQYPVIFDSIRVSIDGSSWELVDYFTDSQPRKEFRVEFDSEYHAFIIFGNNKAGLIPPDGSSIQMTYRSGGGIIGNIISGLVETQTIINAKEFQFQVPITYSNYTRGEYGYDGDTIDDIRDRLPRYLKMQNRIVTGEDYKTFADLFSTPYNGQIGKSVAVLRNYGCAANIIDLYILARDLTTGLTIASQTLKNELQNAIEEKKIFTDYVCIKDGTQIIVDLSIEAVVPRAYRKFEEEMREKITRRVNEFFALANWEYGETLRDLDLLKKISDVPQVERYEIGFTTDDPNNSGHIVTAKFFEIIRLDATSISFTYI
jgi:hypothetical protein